MMHVLFLLLQEVETHRVESIRAEFIVANKHQKEIEYDTALNVNLLVLATTHLLRL